VIVHAALHSPPVLGAPIDEAAGGSFIIGECCQSLLDDRSARLPRDAERASCDAVVACLGLP
jgi:hypothetical protein